MSIENWVPTGKMRWAARAKIASNIQRGQGGAALIGAPKRLSILKQLQQEWENTKQDALSIRFQWRPIEVVDVTPEEDMKEIESIPLLKESMDRALTPSESI